jgi:peroxiredoxin
MSIMRPLVWLTLLFLLLSPPLSAQEGQAAPDFTLQDLEGQTYTLSELKGKVVLLDFWASWCQPCLHAIPALNRLSSKFQEEDFLLLGINVDRSKSTNALKRFVEEYEISYPVLADKRGKVAGRYRAFVLPLSYLIDKKGKIAERMVGYNLSLEEELEGRIDSLLEQSVEKEEQ